MTTNDAELAERVRSLRHHGWSPSDRYDDMPRRRFNYRLSDILCAVGIPQVRRLDELLAARERDRRRLRGAARATSPSCSRRPTRATATAGRRT